MAQQPLTDRDIVKAIGTEALLAHGYTAAVLKKWIQKKRGIPWRERAKIAAIAAKHRKRLPSDFLQTKRMAA